MGNLGWILAGSALANMVLLVVLWRWGQVTFRIDRLMTTLLVLSATTTGLAVAAFVAEGDVIQKLVAAATLGPPAVFFVFQAVGKQPDKTAAVEIGQPMIPFEALDGQGRAFQLSSLSGRPYFLKFYRGHW